MGSLRFRRSVKIAPGIRLNFNKRSVGISAGVRGARYSVNSSGRRTRSVGIPGTGLSHRSQSSGRRRGIPLAPDGTTSPTRLIASLVGWLTLLIFVVGIFNGAPHFVSTMVAIGVVVYVLLRVLRGILDPPLLWLLTRNAQTQ
jgi:hypothetical protein